MVRLTSVPQNIVYVALVLLLALSATQAALDAGEIAALSATLQAFPSLAGVTTQESWDDGYLGTAWTNAFSEFCGPAAGYKYYGIHCNAAGQIDGLRFSMSWGPASTSDFSFVAGFTHLTNYSIVSSSVTTDDLSAAILSELDIQHLALQDLGTSLIASVEAEISLRSLTVGTVGSIPQLMNFTNLVHLEYLTLSFTSTATTFDYRALEHMTSLRFFSFNSAVLQEVGQFEISIRLPPSTTEAALIFYTSPVTNLELVAAAGLKSFFVSATALQELHLSAPNLNYLSLNSLNALTTLDVSSTSVETLFVSNGRPNLTEVANWTQLKSLYLSFVQDVHLYLTSLHTLPNLNVLLLDIFPDIASDLLCSVGQNQLQQLDLSFGFGVSGFHFECIGNHSESLRRVSLVEPYGLALDLLAILPHGVTELYVQHSPIPSQSLRDFVEHFPDMTAFSVIQYSEPGSISYLDDIGTHWPNLETLHFAFSNLHGSIPSDFWTSHAHLKDVYLAFNYLNGSLPSQGWSNLISLGLQRNQISDFPVIVDAAPQLLELFLEENDLVSFPSDPELAFAFPSLRYISVNQNPSLDGPLPVFWNHLDSRVTEVSMANCNFSGSVPALIVAPQLEELTLSNNRLCGQLPEFIHPVWYDELELDGNQFSGGIPSSWANTLSLDELSLKDNPIGGSLPTFPLANRSYLFTDRIASVDLRNTRLTGPAPDLSQARVYDLLLAQNRIDMCSSDPQVSEVTTCEIDPPCACQSYWTTCWFDTGACAGYTPDFYEPLEDWPPVAECIQPPPRVPPPSFYPPPVDAPAPTPTGSTPTGSANTVRSPFALCAFLLLLSLLYTLL